MKIIFPTVCLLLLSQLSYSQEWVRQNPFPFLSQMYDIDFDGPYGLAVGADAAVFTTTNGGETWAQGRATDSTRILTTAYVVPGTNGQTMMAGGDDNIILSEDGGKHWKTTHNYIPDVYKIEALPDGSWIALGRIFGLKSTDKGKLWFAFNVPGEDLTAGHFTSLNEGWVASGSLNNAQVYYTNDGGFTWAIRDSLKHPFISSIDMINEHEGFLASRDFVYKTTDGGDHWEQLHAIASEGGINDLHVADQFNLWTSMNNGSVHFSTDGGQIWHDVNPNVINSNKTLGIWADAEGGAWTVGKYISVLHTKDFGVTWTDQIPASKETMFEPSFYNEFVGMVGASDGTIMRTKNSGAKWEAVKFPRNENFFGFQMVDEKLALAGSSSGKVFFTQDQGDTWTVIGENFGQITDLYAFNQFEITVTTEEGRIYRTDNGGTQWDLVYNNASQGLYAVDFYDHQLGWATGYNGKILNTTDGGVTWTQQYSDGRNQFADVQFTSPSEGWVVSSSYTDTIWHTTNGGQAWTASILPNGTFWRAISFMNPTTGWVAGGSNGYGIVLRTDNGGASWYLTHESPDALIGIYAVPDQEAVWAVGFGGNIVKYSSCASAPTVMEIRGNLGPCAGDTVTFSVDFTGVDIFEWTFPEDWFVSGNSNSSTVSFVAGLQSGDVGVKGRDACGDSTVIVSVPVAPVIPPEVFISVNSGTLVSNVSSVFYQWTVNGVPIPGANDPTYHPIANGIYQLHITTFTTGCETSSNKIDFVLTGRISPDIDHLSIYPNPAKDFIYVSFDDGTPISLGSRISLINMDGKVVRSQLSGNDKMYLNGLPTGVYSLHIESGDKQMLKRLMIE